MSKKKKTALVVRLGAYGDMIIMTPILRRLKEQGYYVIVNTSKRGMEVLKHDPNVDEFIEYKDDSLPIDKIQDHWEEQKNRINADKYINFSGSLECNLAIHPNDPRYTASKAERKEECDINYYEATWNWAELPVYFKEDYIPSLYFTKEEEEKCRGYVKPNKFNILWSMSGSGKNKVYPWTEFVIGEILNNYNDIHIITVGDEKCQILESRESSCITNLSGKVNMRISMCLTQMVDLVISPDTGVLHASGAYATPKIGLLGHTTVENITKHFQNDYSVEADCACAPCYRLIYDYTIQCPVDVVTRAAWCMAIGLEPERIYDRIKRIIPEKYRRTDISE